MKIQLALAALVLAVSPSAFAQPRGNNGGQNNGAQNGGRGGQNGGTLPLPKGINRVISIDAYNVLLAEVSDDDGNRDYAPITVRHVYSGGIAAIFGGVSIPTAQFVSPGSSNNNGGGNQGGVGLGGAFGGGGNNFGGGGNNFGGGGNNFGGGGNNFGGGGNNFGGGGNNFGGGGNNFGGGGNNFGGGGNNFGGGNFSGVSGFNGSGINQGFNGAGNGRIFQTQNGNVVFGQTSVVNPDGTTTPLANGPFVR